MSLGERIINSKSKTFLMFCFCFILGVGFFSLQELEKFWQYRLFVLLFAVSFVLVCVWRQKFWRYLSLFVLFFILGGLRFLVSVPDNTPDNIRYYNGEKKIVSGAVAGDPEIRNDSVRYTVNTGAGRVLVKTPLYPMYASGDVLKIQCNLQAPKNFVDSNFRYDNYLARQGIFSVCASPKIITVDSNKKVNLFFKFKNKLNQQVEQLWPEPESSLVAGLLYGARGGFSAALLEDFSRVGITHIIAISGYNISIIATIMMSILIGIGFHRRQAFWFCVAAIVLFVLFVGASASVVRAGIMGVIVLLAQQLGRLSRIGNVLVFTAAMMLLLNPFVLVWDAGFQLSFLATVGLVYLSPLIEKIVPPFSNGILRETLVSTFSAIIITLPFILFQFNRLSLVAPLANVLILWIIPWLMLFGFIALIISFILYPLAQVIAWITGLGLKYVIVLTEWLGGRRWVAVDWAWPWWLALIAYVLLFGVVYKKRILDFFKK